jgi:fibronectin-binding autotransporter adhesin
MVTTPQDELNLFLKHFFSLVAKQTLFLLTVCFWSANLRRTFGSAVVSALNDGRIGSRRNAMMTSRRRNTRLWLATAAGLSASVFHTGLTFAQQNPSDQTVFFGANDSANSSSFTATNISGGVYVTNWQASTSTYSTLPLTNASSLAAGTAPTPGYAYVVTGSATGAGQLRTPYLNTSPITFAGDSLTILPYNGQANLYNTSTSIVNAMDTTAELAIYGNTSNQSITVGNLVLGNGGAVVNYGIKNTVLNGTIDLLPIGTTLDGITTTVSGGIIDPRQSGTTGATPGNGLTVNATLTGTGQLHLVSTNNTVVTSVNLNGSNGNFTGGILLDNTVGTSATAGSSTNPILNIGNPSALGTGTFTIGSNNAAGTTFGSGPTIDNPTGSYQLLSTNMPMQWNGSFNFLGSSSLNMGSGTATLGNNMSLNAGGSILYVNAITGPYTLTVTGNLPVSGALEVPGLAAITTSGLTVGNGATLAFPAATNTQAQIVSYAGASAFYTSGSLLGIDTTGVTGAYNVSSSFPSGSYGINKIGPGTLLLSGTNNSYTGTTVINNGTLQLGSANALGQTADVNLGSNSVGPDGTLDVNGYSVTLVQPTGGAKGGVITNSQSATNAVVTLVPVQSSYFLPNSSFFGGITGNISLVIDWTPITDNTTNFGAETLGGTDTYTGTTTLQTGVLSASYAGGIPTTTPGIIFAGGTLLLGSGQDFSAGFSQAPGQQYDLVVNSGTATAATSLNSSGGSLTVGSENAYLSGSNTLILSAANNYDGSTTVNSGILQIANPKALAGTSGVTVNSYTGTAIGSTTVQGTLAINDSSGSVGLAGGVAGGAPITLNLNGVGATVTTITYRVGVTNHTAGYAYFGALQGTPGATGSAADVWAGNIALGGNGPVGISGGFNNASSGGTLIVSGVISGNGPLVLGLNSGTTTVLAGANTYSGETQINCSTGAKTTVQLGANNAIPTGSGLNFSYNPAYLNVSSSYAFGTETFDLNGFSTGIAYLTNNYSSAIINSQSNSVGTLTIASSTTAAYTGTITDNGSGKVALVFNGSNGSGVQSLTNAANNYSGGTTVNGGSLILGGIASGGKGNFTINGGVTFFQSTSATTVSNLLASGYNFGSWTGNGINSTAAAANSAHTTAVGMYVPAAGSTFDNQTVYPTDVVVAYTYYGDANLDGKVDGSDYSLIDAGYASGGTLTGWQNGDFNYDGVIDGSDYTLIDNAFNNQGGQITQTSALVADQTAQVADQTAQVAGTAAVPEPAAIGLIGLAAAAVSGRRRARISR